MGGGGVCTSMANCSFRLRVVCFFPDFPGEPGDSGGHLTESAAPRASRGLRDGRLEVCGEEDSLHGARRRPLRSPGAAE